MPPFLQKIIREVVLCTCEYETIILIDNANFTLVLNCLANHEVIVSAEGLQCFSKAAKSLKCFFFYSQTSAGT